jgi:phosphatidylglycerophosphatase A
MRWHDPRHVVAFGFGAGCARRAPGTFGTLVAVPLYGFMQYLAWPMYAAVVAVSFLLGIYVCGVVARDLNTRDHPGIVWDEIVGYWVTMAFAPSGVGWMVAGFVLFRIFDIFKPWPVGTIDRHVHGGVGIMLDDVVAGVYSGFVLYVGARLLG